MDPTKIKYMNSVRLGVYKDQGWKGAQDKNKLALKQKSEINLTLFFHTV